MHSLPFYGGYDAQPRILWRMGCRTSYFMEVEIHNLGFYVDWDAKPLFYGGWNAQSLIYGGWDAQPPILRRFGSIPI